MTKEERAVYNREWRKNNPEKIRSYYENDKETYKSKAKSSRDVRRQLIQEAKRGRPCVRCGLVFHPVCLDFHHRDPELKVCAVGRMAGESYSIEDILDEIAKCDIWCANCHRLLSFAPEELIN